MGALAPHSKCSGTLEPDSESSRKFRSCSRVASRQHLSTGGRAAYQPDFQKIGRFIAVVVVVCIANLPAASRDLRQAARTPTWPELANDFGDNMRRRADTSATVRRLPALRFM